jgi:hypothetical protein
MWLKYRHTFSYGPGDWEWRYLGKEAPRLVDLEEDLHELRESYNWSEHYRGVDHEVVDKAPTEVVEKMLKETLRRIEGLALFATDLKAQL